MRYQILHTTTYQYDRPVALNPHLLRLRPRSDGYQQLQSFALQILPEPLGQTQILDAEGNAVLRCWWSEQPTETLQVQVMAEVETFCTNPFNYLLEPWAMRLPIDYPRTLLNALQPALGLGLLNPVATESVAIDLSQALLHTHHGNPIPFLTDLNQQIQQTCQYQIRETGDPLPPTLTWSQKAGSCRDLAVLLIAICRSVGLAARFVSGYQEGDPAQEQHLHAWVEVYLPGAGWRGYDPTLGLVVSDRHIPLAASVWPPHAAPVSGSLKGKGAQTSMSYQLGVQPR